MKTQINTMRTIAQSVKWADVNRAIHYYYPTDKNNYKSVFEKIRRFQEEKPKLKNEVIRIRVPLVGSFLTDTPDEQFYSLATNFYSLSFRPWSETANLPIEEQTLSHHTVVDLLAFYIWEITFYGTEDDSMRLAEELQGRVQEIKQKNVRSSKKSK